jgi:hypothetical protein
MGTCRIGIDIGGTFTDFVIYHPDSESLETFKLLSTPHDPAQAVLAGLRSIIKTSDVEIVHGSTVATNALLERKGALTALVTTTGFRDVLQIGRQNRPSLYNLEFNPPLPLVPESYCLEVNERVDHTTISSALDQGQLISCLILQKLKPDRWRFVCCSRSWTEHEILLTRGWISFRSPASFAEYVNTAPAQLCQRLCLPVRTVICQFGSGWCDIGKSELRVMQSVGALSALLKPGGRCPLHSLRSSRRRDWIAVCRSTSS